MARSHDMLVRILISLATAGTLFGSMAHAQSTVPSSLPAEVARAQGSAAYRARYQNMDNLASMVLDRQVATLEAHIREQWMEGLRREVDGLRRELAQTPGRGVMFEVRSFASTLTGQPLMGSFGRYGTGTSPADAVVNGLVEPRLLNDPTGNVNYNSDNSGYIFVSMAPGGELNFQAYFGAYGNALRSQAQALAAARYPNSSAGLLGPAGYGSAVVGTPTPPAAAVAPVSAEQQANAAHRAQQDRERRQQQAASVERYVRDQHRAAEHGSSADRPEGHQPRQGQGPASAPASGGTPGHSNSTDRPPHENPGRGTTPPRERPTTPPRERPTTPPRERTTVSPGLAGLTPQEADGRFLHEGSFADPLPEGRSKTPTSG